jgi:DNA-binding transcriptional LysR family regulator
VDVAFVLDEPKQIADLCVEPLVTEPLAIVTAPGHRLTACASVGPQDFTDETMLLTEAGCTYRSRFLALVNDAGIYPHSLFEFGSVEAIKQCTLAGMGVAVLPMMTVAREVADGRLLPLSWRGPALTMATQLVWHGGRWLSPAMRAVITLSRAIYRGDE